MKAASPRRQARRIKAAGVEARSPLDQGSRESPSLMTENPREDAVSRRIRRKPASPARVARETACAGPPSLGRRDVLIISRLTSIS